MKEMKKPQKGHFYIEKVPKKVLYNAPLILKGMSYLTLVILFSASFLF